ncbi:MAG: diaminohydroxyphosphoribosylaminopyrimidine deaminase [Micrococcales bacterium]|nr:MAG: diaminohydroxyphosphoribosylaminopyrimidine deaminase [Micrococcales bacterium]
MTEDVDLTGLDIDTTAPALVSGATGYLAGWIVKGLLDAGVTVHAAVRDPGNEAKVAHLKRLGDQAPGELRLFSADLLEPGSYAEAMAGCAYVFHTASPFIRSFEDPQTELVDPAVKGTTSVLTTANETPSVCRIVLTSSVAAIYSDAADCAFAPGGVLTEDVWNTRSTLTHEPYSLSKTLAEKAAWQIAGAQDRWRLVVINPALVIGPALNDAPTSASFTIVQQLGDGTMKLGVPRVSVPLVDVRDVARAHLAAAYLPTAQGRHIVRAVDTDVFEMTKTLREEYASTYPLPKRAIPKALVWLLAPSIGLERDFVKLNVGHPIRLDNSKSVRRLGMTYRPVAESMQDMFAQMIQWGTFDQAT